MNEWMSSCLEQGQWTGPRCPVVRSVLLYDFSCFLCFPDRGPPDEAAACRGRPRAAPSRPAAGAGGQGAPGEGGEGATAATLAQTQHWQGGDAQGHVSWITILAANLTTRPSPPPPHHHDRQPLMPNSDHKPPQESWPGHDAPLFITLALQNSKIKDSTSDWEKKQGPVSLSTAMKSQVSGFLGEWLQTAKETRVSKSSTDLHLPNSQNWKLDHKNERKTDV